MAQSTSALSMLFSVMALKRELGRIGMYFLMFEEVRLKKHLRRFFPIKNLITLQVVGT